MAVLCKLRSLASLFTGVGTTLAIDLENLAMVIPTCLRERMRTTISYELMLVLLLRPRWRRMMGALRTILRGIL